nr:MAG TPA_asm: hypothetical protein [Caudoviricetes sp.]
MATTISVGTLRLLFALIGYRAKARKKTAAVAVNGSAPPATPPSAGLTRRVDCASRCALTADRCQIASRRADPYRWRR